MLIVDELANHLEQAGDLDRAATPLGMYVAWCVNLGLFNRQFELAHEQLVLRVRYREITGSELLVAGCGGRLCASTLNDCGATFTRQYYAHYLDDYRSVFGEEVYAVADNWVTYDRLAPLLTEKYLHPTGRQSSTTGKRWWQIWR